MDEFVEGDAVEVVAVAAEPADEAAAGLAVGGIAGLERVPSVADAIDGVAGRDQAARENRDEYRDRHRTDALIEPSAGGCESSVRASNAAASATSPPTRSDETRVATVAPWIAAVVTAPS